ncbi:MAG TPA: carboxypeptidase-like regulatory domain-containing protein [Bacteroidales bacterium]
MKIEYRIVKAIVLKVWIIMLIFILNQNINLAQEFHGGDTPPIYKGGNKALKEFIDKNLIFSDSLKNVGISGIVTLKLLINKEGKIENIRLMRGINGECDSIVIRVARLLEDWQPATKKGKSINLNILLPIEINCKNNYNNRQRYIVTGNVTEKYTEKPIEGALVLIKGTDIGTITDSNGKYSLEIPRENLDLEISSIGYITKKEEIGKNHTINIELDSEYYIINFNVNN